MSDRKIIKLSLLVCLLNVAQISKPNPIIKLCVAPLAGLSVYTGCKLLDKAEKQSTFLKESVHNISGLSLLSLGAIAAGFITSSMPLR